MAGPTDPEGWAVAQKSVDEIRRRNPELDRITESMREIMGRDLDPFKIVQRVMGIDEDGLDRLIRGMLLADIDLGHTRGEAMERTSTRVGHMAIGIWLTGWRPENDADVQ